MTESGDKQSRFRRSLEGIGDILVFETKRKGKNQVVMDGLKKLQSTLEDFFNLQESDPDRFNELMLAPDFLELQRTDPREAGARLLFLPEKQFVSLTVALTQIRRVHETAIDVKNEEISRQATYHLIWILDHLTKRPGNDIFIRQLLRNLWQVTELAIESNDPSVHSGALTWYFHTVFRTKVDLSYLALLTEHFRQFVQDVISNDRWELFTSIVSSLHTSVLLPINQINKLWDYEHHWVPFERTQELDREHNIRRRLQALMQSAGDVDSVEEYEAWLKDLAQVDAILDPHVSPENREQKNKV